MKPLAVDSHDMVSWLRDVLEQAEQLERYAILATLTSVATLAIGSAAVVAVLIRVPADYFRAPRERVGRGILRSIGAALRNVLGGVLILVGVLLSFPGVPGQGLLTMLAGLFLVNFPGKRRLLVKILRRPPLLRLINRLRTKFSRPPLVIG